MDAFFDTDVYDDYVQRWACPAPSSGTTYRVLRDEWNADFTIRTIHEWEAV